MATTRTRRFRTRGILGPLILIALGALLLLTNLGYVTPDVWRTLAQLWPVLLVLLGIELLVSGRASWGPMLVAVLIVLIAAAVIPHTTFGSRFGPPFGRSGAGFGASGSFSQPIGGAQSAAITVQHGAGQLEISSGAPSGQLVDGAAAGDSRAKLNYRVENGVGTLELNEGTRRGFGDFFFGDGPSNDLSMRLTRDVPIRRLQVNTGASNTTLDLTDLQLQALDLKGGASQIDLRLPNRGVVNATVNAGASNLTVAVPQGVAAHIVAEGGLANLDVDAARFPSLGSSEGIPGLANRGEYQSANYNTAQNRVEL
ncbi:MAG: hypothetical protein QOF51_3241, partial [Chloroflexota bacterium]|nr:hypothetical protein [Chloroflexota bacterium]